MDSDLKAQGMMKKKINIVRFDSDARSAHEDWVAREFPLTIMINGEELATLLCSPKDMRYLAAGFLFSEGFIESKEEIKRMILNQQKGVIRVETRGDKEYTQESFLKRQELGDFPGSERTHHAGPDPSKKDSSTSIA